MDRHQREVLRRKRPIIADVLDFSAKSQQEYRELNLLVDEMLQELKSERSEYGRVFKWLELLPVRGSDAFHTLASLLASRGQSTLAHDMQAELQCERGLLEVEEYVIREAGMVVHKHWGRSKRISEVEKKEIQRLLSERYQTAKEGCNYELKLIQSQLDEALSTKDSGNGKMKELVLKMHAFLRVEHDRLDGPARGVEDALDVIQNEPTTKDANEKDYGEILSHVIDSVFDILSRLLYEKEAHEQERSRCIEMLSTNLGTEEEKPVYHVDVLLEEVIQNYEDRLNQARREAEISDKLAKSMQERYNGLKAETDRVMAAKEERNLKLESDIIEKTATIMSLQKKELELQDERDRWMDEVEKWKKRCEMIEKTRRIGYYPGYYDKPAYYDSLSRSVRRHPHFNDEWSERRRTTSRMLQNTGDEGLVQYVALKQGDERGARECDSSLLSSSFDSKSQASPRKNRKKPTSLPNTSPLSKTPPTEDRKIRSIRGSQHNSQTIGVWKL